MNDITFSILVPAFKSAFLKDCIDSIINQTYRSFELIIVDDASPEDLKSIVRKYEDSRIRYYRNEINIGAINVVDNWNKCLSYAQGDYVICMGDDDVLCEDCLLEYSFLIEKYPDVNVFHGRTMLIDANGNPISILEARDEWESVWANIYYRWKGRYQYIGDYVFKTDILREMGGFYKLPLAWGADDISVNMIAKNGGIANTNHVVFKYRVNPYSITSSNNSKVCFHSVCLESDWYHQLIELSTSTNDMYYSFVKSMFGGVMLKKKLSYVIQDISTNYSNIIYWFRRSRESGISYKMIIYAVIMAIVNRNVNKYKVEM